jgi:alkylated DNA repair dioxygenase AlkB
MREITQEPTGFTYTEDFIDQATEDALLTYLSSLDLQPITIRGNTSKRTTHHFGVRYDYGSHVLRDTEPIPSEFAPIIAAAEVFAGLANGEIVEALVNRYPPGASVGWHNDAAVYNTIIGISLGAPCTIQFRTNSADHRRVFERLLTPRSAYIIRDAARDDWQHRIPPTKSERFSLTLRSLADRLGAGVNPDTGQHNEVSPFRIGDRS